MPDVIVKAGAPTGEELFLEVGEFIAANLAALAADDPYRPCLTALAAAAGYTMPEGA